MSSCREEAENARELYSLTKGGFSHKGPSALTVQGHKIGNSIRTLDLEHLIKRLLDDDQSEATAMSTSKVERLTDRIAQGRNARELVPHTKGGFSQRGLDVLTVQGHKIKKSIRTFDDAYAFLSIHLCSSLILSPSATAQISRTSAFRTLTLNG